MWVSGQRFDNPRHQFLPLMRPVISAPRFGTVTPSGSSPLARESWIKCPKRQTIFDSSAARLAVSVVLAGTSRRSGPRTGGGEQRFEDLRIRRFGEVVIESRIPRTLQVRFL